MSKTTEYVLIGGGVLVIGYFLYKNMSTSTTTVVAKPVTTPVPSTTSVETTGLNDATSIINNIL
jgi:hypothetical protein